MANNSLGSISLKLDVTKTLSNFQNDLDSIIKTLNQNPKEIAVKLKPITTDLDKYLKSAGNGKNSLANGISISSSDFHIDDLINKAKRLYDAQGTISTAIHNVIDAQRQMQAALASDTGVDEARENLQKLVGDLNTLYQTQSRYDRNTSFANDLKKGINDARLEVIKLEQTYSNLGNTRTAKQLNTDIASLKRLLNSIGDDNDLQTLIQSSEQVDKLMQKIASDVKLFKLDINNIDFNKMFGDKTLSSRVADVASKLKSLSNGGVEVSQMIKTLRSEERAFNDAKSDETKLEHYRQLTVLLEQANMAYNDMSRAEKAANSDEALRKKIQTAREQLQILQDFSLNNMSGASEDTINRVATAIQKLQEALNNVHTDSTGGKLKQEASEVEKAYNEVTSAVKYAKAEIADTSAAERQKNAQDALARSVHAAKDKWTEYQQQLEAIRGHDDLKQKLSAFIAELDKVDNMNDLKNLQDQFRGTEKEIVSITKNTRSFGEIIKEAFGNVGIYLSFQQVFMKVRQIISEMVGDVKELDSAMVELRKVTDETRSTYDKFFEGAKDTAVEIGTTMKDFISSTADFSRLGYNFIDAQELAKVATIYNNVGDDLSGIDEATSTIVSTMKAFGIEASDAITIVDKLNEVSNHYAVSSGDLGAGLARAASALRVSGNTIDEVIAMITGMTEITQNAEAAGLSLRTLSLRLRAADTDLKELGEDTDGVAESTSKLREQIMGLTAVNGHKGFDIMLDKDKIIVLVKLTQIGETPGTDNTEDKVQMYYNQNKIKEMYIIDNLINMRFGKWLVLSEDSTPSKDKRWICKCDCGVEKSVLGKYLLSGKSKSCGCLKKKDLTGQRFGKLVVLETIYDFQNKKRATYLCQCDCGNQIYVHSGSIYKTHSCGCSVRKDLSGQRFGKLVVDKMLCDYKKGKTYFSCTCDCGNSNIIVSENALQCGNTTSCGCLHEPNLINKKFGKLFVQEFYGIKNNQRYWKCICECGQERILSSYVLLSGHTESCGCIRSSAVSKSEIKIAEFLKSKNIKFETQKTFDDCSDVRHLHFDFYLTDYNILIEYDGQQHFVPVEYFGGENSFNTLQSHDKIKNEYCISHHITLLRYNYKSTINSILEDINNKINTFENSVTTTVA